MDKILYILILCGIWSQEAIGTFADEEIRETSDFLLRQKRVVSNIPGADILINDISDAPYVVYIRKDNRISCVGNIVSLHVVLTSAQCAKMEPRHYRVGFASSRLSEHIRFKSVIEIRRRIGDPNHVDDGIALLIVDSMFPLTVFTQPIEIYTGPLRPGTIGKIHGWGYNFRSINRGTDNVAKLRAINVPIISHQMCVERYRTHVQISDKDFCTYHREQHSGHTDFGAGFIVNGHLAGIFLWSGPAGHGQVNPEYPDVFVSLQNPYYNHWIKINLDTIASYFQSISHH